MPVRNKAKKVIPRVYFSAPEKGSFKWLEIRSSDRRLTAEAVQNSNARNSVGRIDEVFPKLLA